MIFSRIVQVVTESLGKRPPSRPPTPDKEGTGTGTIEGEGGGQTTPPSAPFDPNQVTFPPQRTGGAPLNPLTDDRAPSADVASAGDEAPIRLRDTTELKVQATPLTESPDAPEETPIRLRDTTGPKVEDTPDTEDTEPAEEIPIRLRDTTGLKVEGTPLTEDPDAGGEVVVGLRDTTGLKVEGTSITEDPDAGGEVVVGLRDTTELKVDGATLTEDPDAGGEVAVSSVAPPLSGVALQSSDPEEGGEVAGGDFNIKLEEVVPPPVSPSGVPIPYPIADDASDGGSSLADALARKAGEGQKDYLAVKMDDVLVSSRETTATGRTEVRDSHDRHANVEAEAADRDDDPDSSTLLSLEASPGLRLVRSGLAGTPSTDLDLDLVDDADADLDDDQDDVAP